MHVVAIEWPEDATETERRPMLAIEPAVRAHASSMTASFRLFCEQFPEWWARNVASVRGVRPAIHEERYTGRGGALRTGARIRFTWDRFERERRSRIATPAAAPNAPRPIRYEGCRIDQHSVHIDTFADMRTEIDLRSPSGHEIHIEIMRGDLDIRDAFRGQYTFTVEVDPRSGRSFLIDHQGARVECTTCRIENPRPRWELDRFSREYLGEMRLPAATIEREFGLSRGARAEQAAAGYRQHHPEMEVRREYGSHVVVTNSDLSTNQLDLATRAIEQAERAFSDSYMVPPSAEDLHPVPVAASLPIGTASLTRAAGETVEVLLTGSRPMAERVISVQVAQGQTIPSGAMVGLDTNGRAVLVSSAVGSSYGLASGHALDSVRYANNHAGYLPVTVGKDSEVEPPVRMQGEESIRWESRRTMTISQWGTFRDRSGLCAVCMADLGVHCDQRAHLRRQNKPQFVLDRTWRHQQAQPVDQAEAALQRRRAREKDAVDRLFRIMLQIALAARRAHEAADLLYRVVRGIERAWASSPVGLELDVESAPFGVDISPPEDDMAQRYALLEIER